MKNVAIFTLLAASLSVVSCKEEASTESVSPSSSEVPASVSITVRTTWNSLSEDQFDAALHNMSTAPNYVLLSVTEGNSELPEDVCVTAMDFVAAICRELGLGLLEAQEYALNKVDRTYQFSNPRAIQLFARNYTYLMLTEARFFLMDMTVEEIAAAIRSYYRTPKNGKANYAALAHALAERGILSVKGCLGEFRLDSRHTQPADG